MADDTHGDGIEQLILRAKSGDTKAAQCVATSFQPLLRREAKRVAPPDMVEDAVGEGVLAVYTALRAYDPARNRPFAAYLKVVVHHALTSWAADESHAQLGLVSFDEVRGDEESEATLHDTVPDSAAPIPSERAATSLDGIRAMAELSLLPEYDQAAVRRHVVRGETLESIGESEGCTRARVLQRVDTGLALLRRRLETRPFRGVVA